MMCVIFKIRCKGQKTIDFEAKEGKINLYGVEYRLFNLTTNAS